MHRQSKYTHVLAAGIFFVLILLLYKDFLLHLNSKILFNNGDPALNLYFLKWGADYILGEVAGASIFNLPIAYPFENSLAFSDNLFGNQIIFLPYYLLTGNPLFSFNLWIVTTIFLNFYSMFIYIKHSKFIGVRKNTLIPIIGASIFAFSIPSFDLLGGHLQLLPLYFIPITLFLLEKTLITLKYKYFVLLGLAISFQFYLGIQTGFILLIVLILLMPVYYVYLLKNKKLFFKRIWISLLLFATPTIILLLPYLQVSKLTGHRTYADVLNYIPSVTNFFSTGIGEKAIFIGFPTFIIFLFSIYLMKTQKSKILMGVVILSYLFFLKETHIFKLFFTYIPGFDSIRTPGRFIFVSITSIAIFVSVVFSNIDTKKIKYIFYIFILGMSVSLYQKHIPSMQYKYFDNPINSKALQIINHEPTLILPLYQFKNPDVFDIIKRMKNVNMQFPILDIYSGFNPKFVAEIEDQYINKINSVDDGVKFMNRILKLGFKNIIVEKNKSINKIILNAIIKKDIFGKVYEDNKIILYSLNKYKEPFLSLNDALKKTSWNFKFIRAKTMNNQTIFTGKLDGSNLSGVVQEKEAIPTAVSIKDKKYQCQLQLDKIKDSYSSFECISKNVYPEFLSMNRALKNPKVRYRLIKSYDDVSKIITIKVTNTGKETWLAGFSGKYGLALSYKIESSEQNITTGYDGRFFLPYKIEANESFEIEIPVNNLQDGENMVSISMVQEGLFWFHDRGNKPLAIKVYKGDSNK